MQNKFKSVVTPSRLAMMAALAALGIGGCATPKPVTYLPVTSAPVACPALISNATNLSHEIATLPSAPSCHTYVNTAGQHAFSYEVAGHMRIAPDEYLRVVVWKTDSHLADWGAAQVATILAGGHVRPFDKTVPVKYNGRRIEAAAFEFDNLAESMNNSCLVTDLQDQAGTQTRIVVCREVRRHTADSDYEHWWMALQIAQADVPFIQGPDLEVQQAAN